MLQHIDLSHNSLTGTVDLESLAGAQISIMEQSFALFAGHGADFVERFYSNMFARYPQIRRLFANTEMRRQREHLLSASVTVIENLRCPDELRPKLEALGRRHLEYGVSPSHYYALSAALLETIQEVLGTDWNDAVRDAWSDGLDAISRTMMRAVEHPSVPATVDLPRRSSTGTSS
jgi:hemoglobin-like flavoprotein